MPTPAPFLDANCNLVEQFQTAAPIWYLRVKVCQKPPIFFSCSRCVNFVKIRFLIVGFDDNIICLLHLPYHCLDDSRY
jgi:hypothetical protein